MEVGIIAEVDKENSKMDDLESEKLQELLDIFEEDYPEIAEDMKEEMSILDRLQEQEETDAIIEVFDDSSPSGGSTYTTTTSAVIATTTTEMRAIGFPDSMIQTVIRNLDELKNKVNYSIGNMEIFAELNELEFDPELIDELMGNLNTIIKKS